MDRLVRVLIRHNNHVILDDKHRDYHPLEDYTVKQEELENGTTIILYYKHEIDHPGLQPL